MPNQGRGAASGYVDTRVDLIWIRKDRLAPLKIHKGTFSRAKRTAKKSRRRGGKGTAQDEVTRVCLPALYPGLNLFRGPAEIYRQRPSDAISSIDAQSTVQYCMFRKPESYNPVWLWMVILNPILEKQLIITRTNRQDRLSEQILVNIIYVFCMNYNWGNPNTQYSSRVIKTCRNLPQLSGQKNLIRNNQKQYKTQIFFNKLNLKLKSVG